MVVIDLQKGIVGRQTAPHASDLVVKNAAALAAGFRKNGMPVFLVRVTPSPDGKDALRPVADVPMPNSNHALHLYHARRRSAPRRRAEAQFQG